MCMNVTHAYIVCILKKDEQKNKKRIIPHSWLYRMRMQWKKIWQSFA